MASRLSGDGAAGRWVLGCPNAMCDGGRRERAVRGAVGGRAGMARGCLAGEGGEEEDGGGGGGRQQPHVGTEQRHQLVDTGPVLVLVTY